MTVSLAGPTADQRAPARARSIHRFAVRPMVRRLILVAGLTAAWFVTSAAPAAAAGCIAFSAARFDTPGADTPLTNTKLKGEWVRITSKCSTRQVIGGWKIHDYGTRHTYTFPAGAAISAGGSVTLYTGTGTSVSARRYWGKGNYVWNNSCPEKAYLRSASGALRSTYNPLHC